MAKGSRRTTPTWPTTAAVVSEPVWDVLASASAERGPFAHGHTTSLHPVGAAVALANLDIIEREGLVDRAARLGPSFQRRLREAVASWDVEALLSMDEGFRERAGDDAVSSISFLMGALDGLSVQTGKPHGVDAMLVTEFDDPLVSRSGIGHHHLVDQGLGVPGVGGRLHAVEDDLGRGTAWPASARVRACETRRRTRCSRR